MSGFVAVVRQDADPALAMPVQRMSQVLAHRGNLETTQVFSERCAAVTRHREDSGYRVDTYNNERYAIVLDGLVFNREDLIRAIDGDRSIDIAQVVLDGFEKFGNSWFEKIEGSFAIMIVDLRSGAVSLVRDRFAHRPLYFGKSGRHVWIATEIKAILAAPEFITSVNKEILHSSISYGMTPGPRTLFTDIYKCAPGFVMNVDGQDGYRFFDFFTPEVKQNQKVSLPDAKDFILGALKKNVDHYISACPDVGVLLSGGVDSALLAHIAAERTNKKTMAFGFGAEAWENDESRHAREMADRLGLTFARTFVSPSDDLFGSLTSVISLLEEPTRYENALALEITSHDAKSQCTAVMTGEGADFILGEREHAVASRLAKLLRVPGFLRAIGRALPLAHLGSSHLRAIAPYFHWRSLRDYGQKSSANCDDLITGANGPPGNDIVPMLAGISSDWPTEAQYTFMTLREASHCWIERMEKLSAAAGMECFHPFESNDILQFGLEMPDELRNANGINKPAVRALAADIFDDTVAYREKKQLAAPMELWLEKSAPLRAAVLALKSPDSRVRAYLDNDAMNKHLAVFERGGVVDNMTAVHVFRMLSFEIWLNLFFDS